MEITINGLTWSIYYIAEEHFPDKKANLTYFGITYNMSLRIYINKEMHKDILRRTIIHELTHAYGFSYGYNLNKCNEEDICRFVDSHLDAIHAHTQVVMDALLNPAKQQCELLDKNW